MPTPLLDDLKPTNSNYSGKLVPGDSVQAAEIRSTSC